MALLGVAGSLEGVEPVGEALEQRLGREQLRPGGGELERERETVEPVAELHDGVRGGDAGRTACARSQKSATASSRTSGGRSSSASPWMRSASRLVANSLSAGTAAASSASGRAAPGRRCSRLSHTTCVRRSPTRAAIAAGSGAGRRAGRPPLAGRTPHPGAVRAGRRSFRRRRRRRAAVRARSRSASCRFLPGRRS